MELNVFNIIQVTEIPTMGEGLSGFLVKSIAWLTEVTASIALGIILFTLILKLITLPFDFISRASMRRNSLKMEQMRPELERLQKQYAGDKNLYNQKMMALYKKNGYSMWGACLPTILTLVIFILAINGFTSYSQYQNKEYYYEMSLAYNSVVYDGIECDNDLIKKNEETGEIIINDQAIYNLGEGTHPLSNDVNIVVEINSEKSYYSFYTTNGYVKYQRYFTNEQGNFKVSGEYRNCFYIMEDKLNIKDSNGKTYKEAKESNSELTLTSFVENIQAEKAAEKFRSIKASFLWVKNIWITDSPLSHPVESSSSSLDVKRSGSCSCSSEKESFFKDTDDYEKLTSALTEEKSTPNGYFILVVLTALSSLAMQLITSKSQKAQMELQTVDGQGAQTQKMMTWMMPIMMAVFAFIYTAAFSIYIILSSIISMGTTFLINFVVDRKFKKELQNVKPEVSRSRVYVPKEQPKKEQPKKKEKKSKEEEHVDFLNSEAKNRKLRKKK